MTGVLDIIGAVFKPVSDVINHVTISGEDKAKVQQAVIDGTLAAGKAAADYEAQLLDSHTKLVQAEATGASALQRNWRPVTMLVFLALVVCDSFGWLANPLAPQAWSLLQIGLGGYTVGRTVEKIVPSITSAIKSNSGKSN